jgi:hypothetical protein
MKWLTILAMLLVGAPPSAGAQGPRVSVSFPSIRSSEMAARFATEVRPASGLLGDGSKDHRYAGMYTGLGIGALLIIVNLSYCGDLNSNCDSGRVLTRAPVALVFLGGIGALIGRAFPRE